MTNENGAKIIDNSSDRKYFTLVNRIVWAKCRSPFDYTLWATIKMIAGEEGECFLSTPDLATLAMMSAGKVSECRKYLIGVGLLVGEMRRDPGFQQSVWHLRIPDLWKESIEWAEQHGSLKKRVEFKREQREPSCGERGITPHETKKNHIEEPKEIVTQSLGAEHQTQELEYIPEGQEFEKPKRKPTGKNAVKAELSTYFSEISGIPILPIKSQRDASARSVRWWKPLIQIYDMAGGNVEQAKEIIQKVYVELIDGGMTIAAPQSILSNAVAEIGKRNRARINGGKKIIRIEQ